MTSEPRPSRKIPTATDQSSLKALFEAIAARDQPLVSQWLAQSPWLTCQSLESGATRQEVSEYWFASITHYAYRGDTPLQIAAAAHEPDIARDLIAKSANPRARNRRGAEPLHYATDGIPGSPHWNPAAQAAVIQFLLEAGADPNAVDKDGVAPLHRAVRTRCAAAVRTLLENGANPILKNKSGSTPLHLAVQNTGRSGSGEAFARAQQAEIIELLLRHGARPSDKNAAGKAVADCVTADWMQALLNDR